MSIINQHPNPRDPPSGSVLEEGPREELQVLTWNAYAPEKGTWHGWLSTWQIVDAHLELLGISRKPLVGAAWDNTFADPQQVLPAGHRAKVVAFLQEQGKTVCHKCGYVWQTQSTRAWVTCPSCQRKTKRSKR